ncbi:hypothetical protein [Streptomyces sp. c-19]|uniref:hypothetical protein n=1 Tax=Streptomyces sp. c-19 TaxID=2789275 RepID=UPI00397EDBDC
MILQQEAVQPQAAAIPRTVLGLKHGGGGVQRVAELERDVVEDVEHVPAGVGEWDARGIGVVGHRGVGEDLPEGRDQVGPRDVVVLRMDQGNVVCRGVLQSTAVPQHDTSGIPSFRWQQDMELTGLCAECRRPSKPPTERRQGIKGGAQTSSTARSQESHLMKDLLKKRRATPLG